MNRPHTMERAGFPQEVRPHAIPAVTNRETGGYIGGGRLALGLCRKPDGRVTPTDGTWGWDYVGCGRHPQHIFLDWWHDRRCQPKPGSYGTDSPIHVPDPIAAHPIQKVLKGRGGRRAARVTPAARR